MGAKYHFHLPGNKSKPYFYDPMISRWLFRPDLFYSVPGHKSPHQQYSDKIHIYGMKSTVVWKDSFYSFYRYTQLILILITYYSPNADLIWQITEWQGILAWFSRQLELREGERRQKIIHCECILNIYWNEGHFWTQKYKAFI